MKVEINIKIGESRLDDSIGGDCFLYDDQLLMATEDTRDHMDKEQILCICLLDGSIYWLDSALMISIERVKVVSDENN